jgi:ABC-type multidrug transport system fused ATPase/permease subunit
MSDRLDSVDPPDLGFRPTVVRLLGLWRAQWRLVALGLACAFVTTLLSISVPLLYRRVIDDAILAHRPGRLGVYLGLIVALATARLGVNFLRRYSTARIGIRIEARMRELLYEAYLRYPRAFYDQQATGQVVSRATNDLYPIRYFIGWGMVQGAQSAMTIVAVAVVLLVVDPLLAVYALVAMPLVGVLAWVFARIVMPISRLVQQLKADVTEASDEAVVGIEMVQAFGREDDVRARFSDKAEAVRNGTLRQAGVEARYLPGLLFVPTLSIAAVLYFGGHRVAGGSLTLGEFTLFYALLQQLVWPLEALGWIINLGQRAIASASRSFAWLEGIAPIAEPERPRRLPPGPLPVRFEAVRFSYLTGSEVLRGIELELAAGEVVAVCGATGSGKTTLLNLLPRFYDPTGGRVLAGGIDLRELSTEELRRAVAIVTQRPVLFSVPLRDNLTAGRPDAEWEEVLAAAEAAGVAAFAEELPRGYDTLIGERGVNLSGGQRQRVALARALLSEARVLALDDPLSAVDTSLERTIADNLVPALAGRTVLIASQRLSTIEIAHRAVVVENGLIVEDGAPSELVARGGAFARLFGEELRAA